MSIKKKLKYGLSEYGFLPGLERLRRVPETIRWLSNGCKGPAPHPVKRSVLSSYLNDYRLKTFIETGTYLGDTLAYIANDKTIDCFSVELSEPFYREAVERFRSWSNVTLYHGDSSDLLAGIVNGLKAPALFWLDGHYSGGTTGKGKSHTPISLELQTILNSPIRGHVILIDDARCFDGTHGYPHLDQLLESVRLNAGYRKEISADIIRLTPF